MTHHPLEDLPPTLLFQFAAPCRYVEPDVVRKGGLGVAYRIPCFSELEGKPAFADIRLGWNPQEWVFQVDVQGTPEAFVPGQGNDQVQFFIDTRATHNVHRATRFCHLFVFHPFGRENRGSRPSVQTPAIQQARDVPKPPPQGSLGAEVTRREDGYRLLGSIRADALTGYEPAEHPRLGFNCAVANEVLGQQWFTVSSRHAYQSDPSLWGDLELVR
jgi:hypothetical protein